MRIKSFAPPFFLILAAVLTTGSLSLVKAQAQAPLSDARSGERSAKPDENITNRTINAVPIAINRGAKINFRFAAQDEPNNLGCNFKATGLSNTCYGSRAGQFTIAGHDNSFFGTSAGLYNTDGAMNTFIGSYAGVQNREGNNNAFFGSYAGYNNIGNDNSFFGMYAGTSNTKGDGNAFFGARAGFYNTGGSNSFVGMEAGYENTTGRSNAFFGNLAGRSNTSGNANVFIGIQAGQGNTIGYYNTFVGSYSGGSPEITNATAIGAYASVTRSNSLVLGPSIMVNGVPPPNVGIGTTAPAAKLHVEGGDVYIKTQNNGIILRATDGPNCFRVNVNNTGVLTPTRIDCP